MESVTDLIEKAKVEEEAYNLKKAADLYEEIAKFKLERNQKEEAAEIFKKIGNINILTADTSDLSEEYERYNRKAINAYKSALTLFIELENEAEQLECLAEKEYINMCLSQSTEEAKSFSKNSHDLFKESNRIYTINSNQEGILRTYSRAVAAASKYVPLLSEKKEIERISDDYIKLTHEVLEISKNLKDFKYAAEYFYYLIDIYYPLFFIMPFKKDRKIIQVTNIFFNLCLDLLRAIKDVEDLYIQGLVRYTVGLVICFYGFQMSKDDVEQQEKLKEGLDLLISSLQIGKKINLKHLIIRSIYWINWWAFSGGKIELIQDKVLEYMKKITDSAKLYENVFSLSHYYAQLMPAFLYTNLSFRKLFSERTRISHAKRSINYAKKGIDMFSPYPCSSWYYQMLVWSYANLALLSKNSDERDNYSEIMMNYARTFEKIAEPYEGGLSKAVQYSGMYIAYKTQADLAKDKNKKIKMLTEAAEEQKKYMKHALESRSGIIISYIRLGLLFEEIGILSGENEHLNSAKAVFSEAANESIEKRYFSYAAVAFEHNARMEDRLGNHSFAAENYKKAQKFYIESLRDIGFEPLIIKINEKINYTQAWNLIEIAKSHHKQEDHVNAKNNYVKAYEILKELPNFKYEAPYYNAWKLLEEAEYYSKEENHDKAIETFNETKFCFQRAIDILIRANKKTHEKIKKNTLQKLEKVAKSRINYSTARANIEEAMILGKKGLHQTAAEKFAEAGSLIKEICNVYKIEKERIELEAVHYLCKAWQSMELAEQHQDSIKFLEAADLFKQASTLISQNKTKMLALGNSAFCSALELGSKFDESLDVNYKSQLYPNIKMMLRKASTSYKKGGFQNAADWALATSIYFDAAWNLIKADEEMDLDAKKNLLMIGSKILTSASELFAKAGYKHKEKEIKELLEIVKTEKKIIISALSSIEKPSESRSMSGIIAPSCSIESSLSPSLREIQQMSNEVLMGEIKTPKEKYKLIYKDVLEMYSEIQKNECRVGLAQIGVSKKGNIMREFYEIKSNGLLGIREDKLEDLRLKITTMIEDAHNNGINVLIFPEMSIDLNYGQVIEDLMNYSKKFGMYIISGSYHDFKTKRNISVVFGPEGVVWEQEKHIPALIHFGGKQFKEAIKTSEMPRKTVVCNTEFGRMAILICRDFLDMDLRVELKNFEPPVDIVINPAFTPVTADFKAAHFDARRSIYAYCFFVNIAEFGDSLIYTPEKERIERTIPSKSEGLIYKDIDLFKLRSERKKWEIEKSKDRRFIQSTR